METQFILTGTHNGQPIRQSYYSPANLGQRLAAMLERGNVGDRFEIEIVESDLDEGGS